MRAKELRAWARRSLRGKIGVSLAVCLVGSLISTGIDVFSGIIDVESYEQSMSLALSSPRGVQLMLVLIFSLLLAAAVSVALNGVVSIGVCRYFTNLASRRTSVFGNLFSGFRIILKAVRMNLVMAGFIFLWTLAGVAPVTAAVMWWTTGRTVLLAEFVVLMVLIALSSIPGVIAGYRYAMVPYIVAEFNDISVMDAMTESKRLMKGNLMRFFCLQLSFLGWTMLSLLTLGIGALWLAPYKQAANAAFYLDVTGRNDQEQEEL